MRAKVAKGLLHQKDQHQRNRLVLVLSIALVVLFLADVCFANLSSPLKLIPQTFAAVAMGYVLLYIRSLRQFKFVAEFINWPKVTDAAESGRRED